jgi:hypothetical protein
MNEEKARRKKARKQERQARKDLKKRFPKVKRIKNKDMPRL